MKIMFVISSLGSGGAEKVLTMLANRLAEAEAHTITIVTTSDNHIFFTPRENIELIHLNIKPLSHGFFARIKLMYKVISSLKEEITLHTPDVVISFITEVSILSILAAKWAKTPIIVSEHSAFYIGEKNKLWKILRKKVYPLADAVVLLTKEDMPKYSFVKEERKFNIVNPLILKQEHAKIQREKIVIAVGRLVPIKGFDMLIEAYAMLETNDWQLMIVGGGNEKENLQELINQYNMEDKIILIGSVKDVEIYYKRASIYVLSSYSEGFPGALCEAMGYGCACIAFDCPTGPKEIIKHNSDGILVEAENIISLSQNIASLMKNETKRLEMGRNSIKIVEKLDVDNIVHQWLALSNDIIEMRKL